MVSGLVPEDIMEYHRWVGNRNVISVNVRSGRRILPIGRNKERLGGWIPGAMGQKGLITGGVEDTVRYASNQKGVGLSTSSSRNA